MLNKICSFGLLAAALAIAPAAQAQQITEMNANQSAAAIGPHSSVIQGLNQQSQQNNFDYGYGYDYTSPAQISNLNATQEGAAVGPHSSVVQGLNQQNTQDAADYGYGYGGYGGYGYDYSDPAQVSNLNAAQSGAAVGPNSSVVQGLNQQNTQDAADYGSYFSNPYFFAY